MSCGVTAVLADSAGMLDRKTKKGTVKPGVLSYADRLADDVKRKVKKSVSEKTGKALGGSDAKSALLGKSRNAKARSKRSGG
jgi:hypothetical protein